MFTLKRLICGSLFAFVLAGLAVAQEARAPIEMPREPVAPIPVGPLVTATATSERVRFVSPGNVVQLRLEVYNETGQKLFDTELHGGNVLDWHLQDGAGARLAAGSYACVLTTKSLSGRLSQRVGLVTVNDIEAAVVAAGAVQLSLAQQQTIGPVEGNAAFTVLQEREAEAITAVTHDGTDGQMTRTRGALSFRAGDIFAGTELEQMRLTEEGNLGIGTDKPQARLDVAGTIRAEKGIEFADGTVQTTGLSGRKLADGTLAPNVAGTGTQNKVAKWTDNAGTLGDSLMTDTGVNVGLGVTSPVDLLDIAGPPNALGRSGIHVRTTTNTGNATLYFDNDRNNFAAYGGVITGGSANPFSFFGVTRADKTFLIADGPSSLGLGIGTLVSQPVIFGTTNAERMRIDSSGNIGIGTNNPTQKLDVSGNINTTTQYHIGGARILSALGTNNLFLGAGAGNANTGTDNSFFGRSAGLVNSSGSFNTFAGTFAGASNTMGGNNAFYGYNAGGANTTGTRNSFFGFQAGAVTSTSTDNSYFGYNAGLSNMAGSLNSFFGTEAGKANVSGASNSFFGYRAGFVNTAAGNSFFGNLAGASNTTATENSFFGSSAGVSNTTASGNSFFGSFAGSSNSGGADNSFFGRDTGRVNTAANNSFFGSQAGESNTSGSLNSFFGTEAGKANISGAANSFFGYRAGLSNTAGGNSFFGTFAGASNNSGANNLFFGNNAGFSNTTGSNNVFIGNGTGSNNTTQSNNTLIGNGANIGGGFCDDSEMTFATAIGAGASVCGSNKVSIGRFEDEVIVKGTLVLFGIGEAGSEDLCQNGSAQISTCSSSLRYKTAVQPFIGGLDILRRLRPIAFTWKEGGMQDLGFGAEDVEKIEPLLVTYNSKGEIEGVKYKQVATVVVNAVKEQQAQIEVQAGQISEQQKLLLAQQQQITALKKLVCLSNPQAEVCNKGQK